MTTEEQVITQIARRSAECERNILAIRSDGRAAFTLMAPNCILFTWNFMPIPEPETFFDICLN